MRIVDEKGRIFGAINVFDAAFLILIVLSIPVFYYWGKFAQNPKEVQLMKPKHALIRLQVSNIEPETMALLKPGDLYILGNGVKNAEIKDILSVMPHIQGYILNKEQEPQLLYDHRTKDAIILIEAVYYPRLGYNEVYTAGGRAPLLFGAGFSFSTEKYILNGHMVGIELDIGDHER